MGKGKFKRLKERLPFRTSLSFAKEGSSLNPRGTNVSTFSIHRSSSVSGQDSSHESVAFSIHSTPPTIHNQNGDQEGPDQESKYRSSVTASSSSMLAAPSPRDLWQEALESLPGKIQQDLKNKMSSQASSMPFSEKINRLVDLAKKKQEECEQKFWRLSIDGRSLLLRDYAARILHWLLRIGDIGVQFAPPQGLPIWAAISAAMQVSDHVATEMKS